MCILLLCQTISPIPPLWESVGNSIIDRIRKRFNVSISEVEHQDLWQRSTIAFSAIGSGYPELELITNAVKETFYNYAGDLEITELKHDIQKLDMYP